MLRLLALTLERGEWDTALAMWDGYLTAATATGLLSTTGPERARVLLTWLISSRQTRKPCWRRSRWTPNSNSDVAFALASSRPVLIARRY